jgi:hypothetical protein
MNKRKVLVWLIMSMILPGTGYNRLGSKDARKRAMHFFLQ